MSGRLIKRWGGVLFYYGGASVPLVWESRPGTPKLNHYCGCSCRLHCLGFCQRGRDRTRWEEQLLTVARRRPTLSLGDLFLGLLRLLHLPSPPLRHILCENQLGTIKNQLFSTLVTKRMRLHRHRPLLCVTLMVVEKGLILQWWVWRELCSRFLTHVSTWKAPTNGDMNEACLFEFIVFLIHSMSCFTSSNITSVIMQCYNVWMCECNSMMYISRTKKVLLGKRSQLL